MTRISVFEEQRRIRATKGISADEFGFMDVFNIAVQDTLRTLPTATIGRGVQNLFDSSEKIGWEEANYKFNLQGEAAFKPEDEVTMDKAVARSEDQARIARHDYIQNLYAQENPTLGVTANIAGSLAAGFMDPTLLALNVGTSVAMTRGISALVSTKVGTNAVNAIGTFEPAMGKAIIQMYDLKAQQTLRSVIMREGAENFLASVGEESLNFVGVGEDRLARKVTAQESLRNIVIGTTIGTGLGVSLDRAGRAGMMSRWNRMFGDKAGEIADVQSKIVDLESDAGVTPDLSHVNKRIDEEIFDAKPWHGETEAHVPDVVEAPKESAFYIPKEGDTFVSVSNRGNMVSLTNSGSHAKNLGKEVDKVALPDDAEILTPALFNENAVFKRGLAEDLAEDLTRMIDPIQKDALVRRMYDDTISMDDMIEGIDDTELFEELVRDLEASDTVDEMFEKIEAYSTAAEIETFHYDVLENNLKAHGYDGYSFAGKGATGETKYTGVSLTSEGSAKLKKIETAKVEEPSFKDKETIALRRAAEDEAYAEALQKRAAKTITDEQLEEILPEEIELDEGETLEDAYATNKRVRENVDSRYEDLTALDPKSLSTDEELELKMLEELRQGKKIEEVIDEDVKKVQAFEDCLNDVKAPNYAPEDIEF